MATKKRKNIKKRVANNNNTTKAMALELSHTMQVNAAKEYQKIAAAKKKSLKQAQTQLAQALNKRRSAKQKKMALASKAAKNPSATTLNQLEKAKNDYTSTLEAVTTLQATVEAIRQEMRQSKEDAQKLMALSRLIKKFNKQWAKKSSGKKTAKARRKPRRSQEVTETPEVENFETPVVSRHRGRPKQVEVETLEEIPGEVVV